MILTLTQIIISAFLVGAILLQQRGGGLSSVFGGSEGAYGTRRGIEKTVYIATIILAILFLLTAIASVVLR